MELAALPADGSITRDAAGCWADHDDPSCPWACGKPAADDLGLCAWHRTALFGERT